MHMGSYNKLIQLARAGRLTTYSDIAPLAGLSMADDSDRDQMSVLLGEILRHEVALGRPLLTAIVVHKGNDNNPGEGLLRDIERTRAFQRIARPARSVGVLGSPSSGSACLLGAPLRY
jgi:hypothetical protein